MDYSTASVSSVSSDEVTPTSTVELYVVVSILLVFCVCGVAGNVVVLVVFCRSGDQLASTVFIVVLAAVDFTTCLAVVPFTVYIEIVHYNVGVDFVCKLYQVCTSLHLHPGIAQIFSGGYRIVIYRTQPKLAVINYFFVRRVARNMGECPLQGWKNFLQVLSIFTVYIKH